MRAIATLIKLFVFALLFFLALRNDHPVSVFLLDSQPHQWPLMWLLLGVLFLGLVLGYIFFRVVSPNK